MGENHAGTLRSVTELKTAQAYQPTGDQPQAIAELAAGIEAGERYQTLLGATGTGKTATMAWIAEKVQRPTLLIAHNKTLAAQLCNELREFFPDNAVEYFVSYYDYYQPEAYVPQADTLHREGLVASTTTSTACATRRRLRCSRGDDAIIVASVSCIYGLGSPEDYEKRVVLLTVGEEHDRDLALRKLVDIQYTRNDIELGRGHFRVRATWSRCSRRTRSRPYRISFFGDEVEQHHALRSAHRRGLRQARARSRSSRRRTSSPRRRRSSAPSEAIRHELDEQVTAVRARGQAARGAAHPAAHRVRPRDDAGARLLHRDRELLAPPRRPPAGLARRTRCSTSSRPTSSSSWTSRTRPCRRSAACTRATARASRRSSTTASACRRRSTTGRCASTSSWRRCRSSSSSRRRPARSSCATRRRVAEQLIRPTGLVDPDVELRPDEGPGRRPAGRDPPARGGRASACS